jgi:hypothetical protein
MMESRQGFMDMRVCHVARQFLSTVMPASSRRD